MPKEGFKSLATVSDYIYNKWNLKFQKQRKKLRLQGINSFSAYIVSKLGETEK